MNKLILAAALAFAPAAFAAEQAMPPGHPAAPAASAPAPQQKAIKVAGKVVETKDSGPYTYILVEQQGKKLWAAIPKTQIKVGQQVTLKEGFEMKNFSSKTMGKTFDSIIFSGGLEGAPSAEGKLAEAHGGKLPAGHPAVPGAPATAPPKKGKPVKVQKAAGANAYTVKQLFDKRFALDGKKVVVRAKVTKLNTGILKRNWVHLEDGTGKAGKEDSFVVATWPSSGANAGIAVGDTVTATGTLFKNRDFGSGYKFYVVLENTTFKKE